MVRFGQLVLSLLLVGDGVQEQTVECAPEDCLVVSVRGCTGTFAETLISGEYHAFRATVQV